MNNNTVRVLQGYLWLICAFHVAVGAGLNLFPGMPSLMADMYGAELPSSASFDYILKPLGAFMFVLGIMAAAAALQPARYRAVIYGFAALFAIRALQRVIHSQEITDVFAISSSRNLGNMVLFFGMAVALVVLERLSAPGSSVSASA